MISKEEIWSTRLDEKKAITKVDLFMLLTSLILLCILLSLLKTILEKFDSCFCEVQKCGWGDLVGDSSGKSEKPLYSKLENYPETQDKSPNSILRLLPSSTSAKVVSGVSSKEGLFYLVNTVKKSGDCK